jgi:hypothetical protein
MSESMVERVAKALKDRLNQFSRPVRFYVEPEARSLWEAANPDGDWDEQPESRDDLVSYKLIARTMLEAMREPTPEMINSGRTNGGWNGEYAEDETPDIWQAMIDAALKD